MDAMEIMSMPVKKSGGGRENSLGSPFLLGINSLPRGHCII